jgi:endonuclease/exonuclease/phosphatase family metal-dependent hydrolase
MKKISLISINCFGLPLSDRNHRLAVLISEITKYKPDIVCLQEVFFPKTAFAVSQELSKAGYDIFYSKGKIFNKGGLLTSTISPMAKKRFVRFTSQGSLLSLQITDRFLGKGYQKVELLINRKKITLLNTHVACAYIRHSKKEKQSQKEQLSQLVNDVGKSKKIILTGDLNFAPEESLYSELIQKTSLADPSENAGLITFPGINTNRKGFHIGYSSCRLDYTLVSKDMAVRKQQVIFKDKFNIRGKWRQLSDHFGLLTEIEI